MEYNELIEKIQHTSIDVPNTDTILGGMRHTLHRRRQRKVVLATVFCLTLVCVPLAFSVNGEASSPTLAEIVSASLPSSPNDLPAPLVGYQNSIRNHQTTLI